jgi:hypothetical protein
MRNKILLLTFLAILLCLLLSLPLKALCQDNEYAPQQPVQQIGPPTAATPTPTPTAIPRSSNQPSATSDSSWFSSNPTIVPKTSEDFNFAALGLPLVGVLAVVGGGVAVVFFARGRKVSESKLRSMPYGDFQSWVLKQMNGKTGSGDIDGFTGNGAPVIIRQTDTVGMPEIQKFAGALAKNRSRNGVIVAFGFGSDAIRAKVRMRMAYRVDIEMVQVNELIYSPRAF